MEDFERFDLFATDLHGKTHSLFMLTEVRVRGVRNGQFTRLFDTQSTPSTSSNPAAEKTPAADDQRMGEESAQPESGADFKPLPIGGGTLSASSGANSPATQSERMTTSCADSSLPDGLSIIWAMERAVWANFNLLDQALRPLAKLSDRLLTEHSRLEAQRLRYALTTQAQEAPASEEGKTT